MKNYWRDLILRYAILVLLSIGNLYIIYLIFGPVTVKISYFILDILYDAYLIGENTILFNGIYAKIINACVAGSAYFLLLALNLTTPMKIKTRLMSILFILLAFLALNIARIVIFASLFYIGYEYFDFTHKFVWYIGSTVLVIGVWFINVKIFKIKKIPVYNDFKLFYAKYINSRDNLKK